MNHTVRNKSVITKKPNLEELYTIHNFPVFIGCTDKDKKNDIHCDMVWDICKDSGIIQLRNIPPLDIIYPEYHSESVGDVWNKHHTEFNTLVMKYASNNILEIGGSNGVLANNFLSNYKDKKWIIIEPNIDKNLKETSNLSIIQDFFDEHTKVPNVDTVVHSHVLEHSYDPMEFIKNISTFLKTGQHQIFSVPNLYTYMKKGFTNTINFEHTLFLTENLIDYILYKNNFDIVEKKYFNDHSIFYVTVYVGVHKNKIDIINEYDSNRELYLKTINDYKETVKCYVEKIGDCKTDVFLFGAHIFSQLPLYFGLDESIIDCVLDNSEIKNGKRLYGTGLHVKKPEAIKDSFKPIVILNVGNYKKEISEQLKLINKNVVIL